MTNISYKRGYVLLMALLFIIIAVITSIGIYAYSGYIAREVRIDKRTATRSYYYSVAGARYAQILLKDPMAAGGFGFSSEAFDGEEKSVAITGNAAGTLGGDLGFSGADTLTITATEYTAGPPASSWEANSYEVKTLFTR